MGGHWCLALGGGFCLGNVSWHWLAGTVVQEHVGWWFVCVCGLASPEMPFRLSLGRLGLAWLAGGRRRFCGLFRCGNRTALCGLLQKGVERGAARSSFACVHSARQTSDGVKVGRQGSLTSIPLQGPEYQGVVPELIFLFFVNIAIKMTGLLPVPATEVLPVGNLPRVLQNGTMRACPVHVCTSPHLRQPPAVLNHWRARRRSAGRFFCVGETKESSSGFGVEVDESDAAC